MKIFVPFMLMAFIAISSCEKVYTDPEIEKMAGVRGYSNWYIGTFRCGLYVPENYEPGKSYPLVIYLHGHTDTTTWNLEWYNEPIASADPCIVLTPKCPVEEISGWGSSYDPRISPMMQKTFEMLQLVEKAFNPDRDRYYIYGTSMGGYGTYGVIQKNPDLFAAGYALCGNGNINLAPTLVNIPFWIFHGSDDHIVPVQPDRDLYKAVVDLGGKKIRYTEYKGVGHNVWDYTRYETTLQSWLLAQRKGRVFDSPDIPGDFTAENAGSGKNALQWDFPPEKAFPSGKNVWFCRIYRNGNAIEEVYNNMNNFIDSSFVINSTCEYQISAVNYYFQESGLSGIVTVGGNKK